MLGIAYFLPFLQLSFCCSVTANIIDMYWICSDELSSLLCDCLGCVWSRYCSIRYSLEKTHILFFQHSSDGVTGDPKWRCTVKKFKEDALLALIDRNGIKAWTCGSFSVDLWSVKNWHLKVARTWPQANTILCSSLRHHEQGQYVWHVSYYAMSQLFFPLLFIGEQQTNLAAPWGAPIWRKKRKKVFLMCAVDRTTTQTWQRKCLCVFCVFRPTCPLCFGSCLKRSQSHLSWYQSAKLSGGFFLT